MSFLKIKAVFAGESGVGKTCIVQRIYSGDFISDGKATVGAATTTIKLPIDDQKTVLMSLWDTAGQERFRSLTSMYFKGAGIAFLVYDISNIESFNALEEFYNLLKENGPDSCVYYIIGNKIDLDEKRAVPFIQGEEYARAINAAGFFEVSALTGHGIKELFDTAAKNENLIFEEDVTDINAIRGNAPHSKKKECC